MGAYVSVDVCAARYGVTINCTAKYTDPPINHTYIAANMTMGQFPGDPDIAGVGITASFIAVTGTALILSLFSVFWRMWKHDVFPFCWRTPGIRWGSIKPNAADIVEAMVLACSDTQIFSGGAYAVTLRYFSGCKITVYHYNIVANMMLLTCATHLMAITVVRAYWRFPWMAAVRVLCSFGVFLVTGILLSNQNTSTSNPFPTKVPPWNTVNSPIFLPAACYQTDASKLGDSLQESVHGLSFLGNHIEGWYQYIVILLWFIASTIAEICMWIRRGQAKKKGVRKALVAKCRRFFLALACGSCRSQTEPGLPNDHRAAPRIKDEMAMRRLKWFGHHVLGLYSFCGVGIGVWVVVTSGWYIMRLRLWVQKSKWLTSDGNGVNSENDPTSFGQMVPIMSNLLILFTLVGMANEQFDKRREARLRKKELDEEEREKIDAQNSSGGPPGNTLEPQHSGTQDGGASQPHGALPSAESSQSGPIKVSYDVTTQPVIPTPGTMAQPSPFTPWSTWTPSPGQQQGYFMDNTGETPLLETMAAWSGQQQQTPLPQVTDHAPGAEAPTQAQTQSGGTSQASDLSQTAAPISAQTVSQSLSAASTSTPVPTSIPAPVPDPDQTIMATTSAPGETPALVPAPTLFDQPQPQTPTQTSTLPVTTSTPIAPTTVQVLTASSAPTPAPALAPVPVPVTTSPPASTTDSTPGLIPALELGDQDLMIFEIPSITEGQDTEKPSSQKPVTKISTVTPTSEQLGPVSPTGKQPVTGDAEFEVSPVEEPTSDKPLAEKFLTEQIRVERPVGQQAIARKPITRKPVAGLPTTRDPTTEGYPIQETPSKSVNE